MFLDKIRNWGVLLKLKFIHVFHVLIEIWLPVFCLNLFDC